MEHEVEDSQPARTTTTRTVRLTADVMSRLQVVCDRLGVTVGAYLTHEIGRALVRDEVALQATEAKDRSLEMLAKLIESASKEDTK